jgi:hypothetical protein
VKRSRTRVRDLLRIVELLHPGVDDHVIVRELSVVDARLVDLRLALRRDVLDHELRLALRRHAADRGDDGTEAVRELQMAVHPALRQRRAVDLSR